MNGQRIRAADVWGKYAPAAIVRRSRILTVCLTLTLIGGCHKSLDPHDTQANSTEKILIVGNVPGDVAIELTAEWQATVIDDACAPKIGSPVGVRSPKHFSIPIQLESYSGGQLTWSTSWDSVKPGHCGWQLAGVDFKADRSASAFAAHARSIAPSRIAFTCLAGCTGPYPRANDDDAQPVKQYCKFSMLGKTDATLNPCAFDSSGKIGGPTAIAVKDQHILRRGQHLMRFSLIDLESDRQSGNAS